MSKAVIHHTTYSAFRLHSAVIDRPTKCGAAKPKAISVDWSEVSCAKCLSMKNEKDHRQWPSQSITGVVKFERGVEPRWAPGQAGLPRRGLGQSPNTMSSEAGAGSGRGAPSGLVDV
jgi:hypothetical protein